MQGFGSMLKDYLEFYKISQTDFAERLGISTKHMNEILSGKTNISERHRRRYEYNNDNYTNIKKKLESIVNWCNVAIVLINRIERR